MYSSQEGNKQLSLDLGYKEAFNGLNNQHNGTASYDNNDSHNLLTHVNNKLSDNIISEKIKRERKLNTRKGDIGIPMLATSHDLPKLDERKEQPPMIVLSNRLPFVLKRNENGLLFRRARYHYNIL